MTSSVSRLWDRRFRRSADTVGKWRRRYAANPRRSMSVKSANAIAEAVRLIDPWSERNQASTILAGFQARRAIFGTGSRRVCMRRRIPGSLCAISRPWRVLHRRCAPGRRSGQPRLQAPRHDLSVGDIATGEIIGKCFPRHREFRKFLRLFAGALLISTAGMDNYGTHKTKAIQDQTAALAGPFHTHQRLLAQPSSLVRA